MYLLRLSTLFVAFFVVPGRPTARWAHRKRLRNGFHLVGNVYRVLLNCSHSRVYTKRFCYVHSNACTMAYLRHRFYLKTTKRVCFASSFVTIHPRSVCTCVAIWMVGTRLDVDPETPEDRYRELICGQRLREVRSPRIIIETRQKWRIDEVKVAQQRTPNTGSKLALDHSSNIEYQFWTIEKRFVFLVQYLQYETGVLCCNCIILGTSSVVLSELCASAVLWTPLLELVEADPSTTRFTWARCKV